MKKMKTIAICLPEDQINELKETAQRLGISVSSLIRIRLVIGAEAAEKAVNERSENDQ